MLKALISIISGLSAITAGMTGQNAQVLQASPSPSASPYVSTSPSPTASPSVSPSSSPTPSPTYSPSPTVSPTPSYSPTPTISPSPTPTYSPSPSPTPSLSPIPSPMPVVPHSFNSTFITHTLVFGSRDSTTNNDVSKLQRFLISQGYVMFTVTGYFGTLTSQALKSWQIIYGLPATGVTDAATRQKIYQYSANSQAVLPLNSKTNTPKTIVKTTISIPTATTTLITSCQEITQPGNYMLNSDISSNQQVDSSGQLASCLKIHDTNNVNLNCNNHSVSGFNSLTINNVNNFTVNSCKLQTNQMYGSIKIDNSAYGELSGNTFGPDNFIVTNTANLTIENNIFYTQYTQHNSHNNFITNNINSDAVDSGDPNTKYHEGFSLFDGSSTIISGNSFTGTYKEGDPYSFQSGSDDGITLTNEQGDTIQNNFIQNNFDCGLENSGFLFDTKIINNTFLNNGFCGIGGWYWNSFKGNTISGNIIDKSQFIFNFFRDYGLRPGDPPVYFKDNIFTNNINMNPVNIGYGSHSALFDFEPIPAVNPGEQPVTSQDIITSNNLFSKNNFLTHASSSYSSNVTLSAPLFYPLSMIIDGGGNICGPHDSNSTNATYPIHCSSDNIQGDVNGDGVVNFTDLLSLSQAYGSILGNIKYNPNTDFNQDGVIDIKDLLILAQSYSK